MRFLRAHTQLLQDLQMESRLDELEERIEGRERGSLSIPALTAGSILPTDYR
jgi:hypothetical protein